MVAGIDGPKLFGKNLGPNFWIQSILGSKIFLVEKLFGVKQFFLSCRCYFNKIIVLSQIELKVDLSNFVPAKGQAKQNGTSLFLFTNKGGNVV